jgi:hypothetical protein
MQIPVACTLGAEDAASRVEEWRQFLTNSILSADPVGPELLRLRLEPSADTLVAAVDLAKREKSCCRFFEFSIDVREDACWLVVGVPQDAASVLADFSLLLPQGLPTRTCDLPGSVGD